MASTDNNDQYPSTPLSKAVAVTPAPSVGVNVNVKFSSDDLNNQSRSESQTRYQSAVSYAQGFIQSRNLKLQTNNCDSDKLHTIISKLKEENRSLQLQLVSEKVLREQESKNASMEMEKNIVHQNAEIYSLKCEVESWKRKAEAAVTESAWLKDQMKAVELEKNQVIQKMVELQSHRKDFDRCRQSFDFYSRGQNELIQMANKKLDELVKAKEVLEKITEENQKQMDSIALQLNNLHEGGKIVTDRRQID